MLILLQLAQLLQQCFNTAVISSLLFVTVLTWVLNLYLHSTFPKILLSPVVHFLHFNNVQKGSRDPNLKFSAWNFDMVTWDSMRLALGHVVKHYMVDVVSRSFIFIAIVWDKNVTTSGTPTT